MEIKKCQRCDRRPRIQGERYCSLCKRVVLSLIRDDVPKPEKVRTCTDAGGRKCRHVGTHQPDSGEGDFREDP